MGQHSKIITRYITGKKCDEFPFKCFLSIKPLITYWQQIPGSDSDQISLEAMAKEIIEKIKINKSLTLPLTSKKTIEQNKNIIDVIMSAIFSPALGETEYLAAFRPFHLEPFYGTLAFQRKMLDGDCNYIPKMEIERQIADHYRYRLCYDLILKNFYNVNLKFNFPDVLTSIEDPVTGLTRYYKRRLITKFIEVEKNPTHKTISSKVLDNLIKNHKDIDLWQKTISPSDFEFHGFSLIRYTNVTYQQLLLLIRQDLIDSQSIISGSKFGELQDKIRMLFETKDINIGIYALRHSQIFFLGEEKQLEHRCIYKHSSHFDIDELKKNSLFNELITNGKPIIADDILQIDLPDKIRLRLLRENIKNVIMLPLRLENQIVGIFEITSKRKSSINDHNLKIFHEVIPLFSIAIKRSLDSFEYSIESSMKDKFTAIHPCVEWRFRKAIIQYIGHLEHARHSALEPIVFNDVFPLFATSDIRSSTDKRNEAIKTDLKEQLNRSNEILSLAKTYCNMPILDELMYIIKGNLKKIEKNLMASDELNIGNFLNAEVEPLFASVAEFGPDVKELIHCYRNNQAEKSSSFYRSRVNLEDSIATINGIISTTLDERQVEAQQLFPHYFEKHITDGVDHSIYIGEALSEHKKYYRFYLKNLRLWQLIVICKYAHKCHQIKSKLKSPIDLAHLVAVQSQPLSIRFSYEEKQFIVEGAYNVRYEIMKKRIDKARIKNSKQRLTQPDKIAIVFSNEGEKEEYLRYIDYLTNEGYLGQAVEQLELEDMQGVHGLKALRVAIDYDAMAKIDPGDNAIVEDQPQKVAI